MSPRKKPVVISSFASSNKKERKNPSDEIGKNRRTGPAKRLLVAALSGPACWSMEVGAETFSSSGGRGREQVGAGHEG